MDTGRSQPHEDVEARNEFPASPACPQQQKGEENLKEEPTPAKPSMAPHKQSLAWLDGYAVSVAPSRFRGALITIFVWLFTMAYAAFVIYQFYTQPPATTNVINWTLGSGPFSMLITCQAASGCFVSNFVDPQGSAGVQPAGTQLSCMFLAYQDTITMNITSSLFPNDGLSVLYDPLTSNPQLPAGGFGYTVQSQVVCETFQPELECPENGVKVRNTPASAGTNLANLVETNNLTVSDAGRTRMEWFLTPVDVLATAPNALTNKCVEVIEGWEPTPGQSLSSGPLTMEALSSAQPANGSPATAPPTPTEANAVGSVQPGHPAGAPGQASPGYSYSGQGGQGGQAGNQGFGAGTSSTATESQTFLPSVNVGNLVQSRILINSNYITTLVEDQTEWSSIFGIIGGSFEMFLGAGAVILATSYGEGLQSMFAACAASGDAL